MDVFFAKVNTKTVQSYKKDILLTSTVKISYGLGIDNDDNKTNKLQLLLIKKTNYTNKTVHLSFCFNCF